MSRGIDAVVDMFELLEGVGPCNKLKHLKLYTMGMSLAFDRISNPEVAGPQVHTGLAPKREEVIFVLIQERSQEANR